VKCCGKYCGGVGRSQASLCIKGMNSGANEAEKAVKATNFIPKTRSSLPHKTSLALGHKAIKLKDISHRDDKEILPSI